MATERRNSSRLTFVQRLLVRLVGLAGARPYAVLLAAAALAALSGYLASTRLAFLTQRNDLVSPHKDDQTRWREYVQEFGDDDDMVVVVRGKGRDAMRAGLEDLAGRLAARPDLFDRVFYKVDLRPLRDRALLYLSEDQIREIGANLRTMSLLLDPPQLPGLDPLLGWKSLTLTRLLAEAEHRAVAAARDGGPTAGDGQLFTQLAAVSGSAADTVADPSSYKSPWLGMLPAASDQRGDLLAEPQYFFSGDGSLAFLLVRPVKDVRSFTSSQASIDTLRGILGEAGRGHAGVEFGLTGLPVLENDEMAASQADTATASWLALLGVALLYLIVYRGYRYPLLTVTTLVVGTVWALGWLTLTVGHLNILSATFAVMLIGLGDYGVLWVTRYEQERAAGLDLAEALRSTTAHAGPGIVTAALTTALAFFTAMLADFHAVAELGWIAGCGVLLCALATFTVLPALVCVMDGRRAAAAPAVTLCLPARDPARAAWLPVLGRSPRWVLAGVAVLTAGCAVFACRVGYDHNLLHLQARGLDSVKWELTLIEHTAGASWHALSWTETPEEALALKARYEKLPGVSTVVEVASLVPPGQDAKLGLVKDVKHRLRRLPPRGAIIPHARPDPLRLRAQAGKLRDALAPLAERGSAPAVKLRDSLGRLVANLGGADGATAAARLQEFEQWLTRDLIEDLHRLRDVASPAPITLADLPTSLRERYVSPNGKWLLRVFGAGSLWEFPALEAFVRQIRQVDATATGKPMTTLEGLRSMRAGFERAALYALAAMAVVLLLDFRNLWHALLALAPLGVGVVLALGLMGLCGVPLNPANMIALPLILGVGADNGVHIVHDFLARRRTGAYALGYCTGRGILVAGLTTVLGFGTLMLSHHRGLAGLGLLLALGVSCCMAAALVFLPALLRVLTEAPAEAEPRPVLLLQTADKAA